MGIDGLPIGDCRLGTEPEGAEEAPVGDPAWNFVGHRVGSDELDLITTLVAEDGGLGRGELVRDALDAWLDQLEAATDRPPTLREISARFLATRGELLSACLDPRDSARISTRPKPRARFAGGCAAEDSMRKRSRPCVGASRCTARPFTM